MKKTCFVFMPLLALSLLASCKSSAPVNPTKYYTITFDAGEDGIFADKQQLVSLTLKDGTKILPYIRLMQPTLLQDGYAFHYYKYKNSDDMINYDDVITDDIILEAHYLQLNEGEPWNILYDDNIFNWKLIKRMAVTNPNPEKCCKINATKFIHLNNNDYPIRIIGFNHDDLVKGGKAGITFEFINLISDENGDPYNVIWDNKIPDELFPELACNYDFPNSVLNEFLNVGDECVFNMLPDDLKTEGIIEEVKKVVRQWGVLDMYNTKLFPLSTSEVTSKTSSGSLVNEGDQYEFWIDNDAPHYRKKSGPIAGGGGDKNYWLRSPLPPMNPNIAKYIDSGGNISDEKVNLKSFSVSPAFCI